MAAAWFQEEDSLTIKCIFYSLTGNENKHSIKKYITLQQVWLHTSEGSRTSKRTDSSVCNIHKTDTNGNTGNTSDSVRQCVKMFPQRQLSEIVHKRLKKT